MAELTDIGTILKQTVFDVAALSFTPVQEQAMRNNVIKAVQSAYVGMLGNAAAEQIAVTEVNRIFTNSTYTGSVTDTGFVVADTAVSIIVDSRPYTIGTGVLKLTNASGIKAGIEAILDSLNVVYSYVLYHYTPPLSAGDKGVIFLQVVGCSSVITKFRYTENGVSQNFTLSAVSLTPKVTYTDSTGAATYVETDVAKPLKVVGITLAMIGAVTFSSPVVATSSANVITAIKEAIGGEFGFCRGVEFSYVIAAANSENSFVACSVFGSWDVVESVQLLKNDVTAFDLTLTAL